MKFMQQPTRATISHLLIFFFAFWGSVYLVSPRPDDAEAAKEIKAHPNAEKKSPPNAEDLKAKADEYNQQAIRLFEGGRYAEAQEFWERAINLVEHPRSRHPDLEVVNAGLQPVESSKIPPGNGSVETSLLADKYQQGLALLEQKDYVPAQRIFQEIEAIEPEYRNTKKYLVVIAELLGDGNDNSMTADQSQSQEDSEFVPEAGGSDADQVFDHGEEQAQLDEAENAAEQKLLEQIADRVEPIYQRALQEYKRKVYVEARHSFEEVQVLSPGYKLTSQYLDDIDDAILSARQLREEEERLTEERRRRQDELEFQKTVAAKEEVYRRESTARAEQTYQQAIENFKNRNFEEAEDTFRKVDTMVPDYKLTGKYLERIQESRDAEAHLQAEEDARRQAFMQHNAEEDAKRTIEESERIRQQALQEKTEVLYQGARTYYGQGDLERARAGFRGVERILPDYRSVRKYLGLIDEDAAREQESKRGVSGNAELAAASTQDTSETIVVPVSLKRAEAEQYYQQAKESYKRREFQKAKELFEKVDAFVKDYQATDKFLARINADIQEEERYQQSLQKQEVERQEREAATAVRKVAVKTAVVNRRQEARGLKEASERIKKDRNKLIERKVLELYREAESDYRNGLYALARERLNQVQHISPGYKATEEYLERIAYEYGNEVTIQQNVPIPEPTVVEALPVREEIVVPDVAAVAPKVAPKEEVAPAASTPQKAAVDEKAVSFYRAGLSFFKQKEYARSRENFEHADQLYPGYKSTLEYLNRIDSLQQREQQREIQAQQKAFARSVKRAKTVKNQERPRPAAVAPATIEVPKPGLEKAVASLPEAITRGEPAKVDDSIRLKTEALFPEAVKLFESNQFVLAREKFLELEQLSPGYKTTPKYLVLIERTMLQEEKKTQRTKQQQDKEAVIRTAQEKAAQKLTEKNKLKIQWTEEKKRQRLSAEADKKYAQAVIAYAKKDFVGAKQKFGEIEALLPNFKETAQYLGRIDADILAQNQKPQEVTAPPIYVRPKEDAFAKKQKEAERLKQSEDKKAAVRIAKEKLLKQKQEALNARLEVKAQKVREQTEKAEREKEIAKIKRQEILRAEQSQKDERNAQKTRGEAEKVRQNEESAKIKQQALEQGAKQRQEDMRNARLEAKAQKVREQAEKVRQKEERANLKEQEKTREAKQRQEDMQKAQLGTNAKKAQKQAEKARQKEEAQKRQQQAQIKPVLPINVPEEKSVWVDPPDLDSIDLSGDVESLRQQYTQIQQKRNNVQGAIQVMLSQTYDRAVVLYKLGHYSGAKNLFNEITAARPSFRGTKNFLAQIDQMLKRAPAATVGPEEGITAPSVFVKPHVQVVTDALDTLEATR